MVKLLKVCQCFHPLKFYTAATILYKYTDKYILNRHLKEFKGSLLMMLAIIISYGIAIAGP